MILYFDSYITEKSLHEWPQVRKLESDIRNSGGTYKYQTKVDIAKYTLSSYAEYPWSAVLIRYELEDDGDYDAFDDFLNRTFESPIILRQRSETADEFVRSIGYLNEVDDDWIFYSGNNDHPMIIDRVERIDPILEQAKRLSTNNVSIIYSHYSECMEIADKHHVRSVYLHPNISKVDEDENAITLRFPDGFPESMQIVHKDLFAQWFSYPELQGKRVFRTECVTEFAKIPEQLVIFPKFEICRHYDAYLHTILLKRFLYIPASKVPPLFIPDGFFENDIAVSYGAYDYRPGFVNINPTAKSYSFEDPAKGTDLKCSLDQIPQFWQNRIGRIEQGDNVAAETHRAPHDDLANPVHMGLVNRLHYALTKAKLWVKSVIKGAA